ncbi:hypothetical protein LTR53_007722 [Teratosphaeriaceae sp. CCFEE 6253]|nr:hypothetical protein LTR53_007722 [Teratosphaeriaceae sp. CCFEE 6253]
MPLISEPVAKGRHSRLHNHAAIKADEIKTTPSAQPSATFKFFRLPRELRDIIYYQSLAFKLKLPPQHNARLRGRRVADASLLRVSKQFRREYLERAEHHTSLIIVDRPEYHGDIFKLPPAMRTARHLEVYLAIACDAPDHFANQCRVVKEVRMHRKWLVDLCSKMRCLDSLSIALVVDPHQDYKACEAKLIELQHKFTNMPELKALEVYHCDYAGKEMGWSFANKRTLVMEWVAGDGEVRRFAKEEKEAPAERKDSAVESET